MRVVDDRVMEGEGEGDVVGLLGWGIGAYAEVAAVVDCCCAPFVVAGLGLALPASGGCKLATEETGGLKRGIELHVNLCILLIIACV